MNTNDVRLSDDARGHEETENTKQGADTMDEQVSVSEQPDPVESWDLFRRQFRSVRMIKNARRLRELRDAAQHKLDQFRQQLPDLDAAIQEATEPLDKLALQEERDELAGRITYLEEQIQKVHSRARALANPDEADNASNG